MAEKGRESSVEHLAKQQLCPSCGEYLNAATNVVGPDGTPDPSVASEPGGLMVCAGCGEALVFSDTMSLEVFNDWEDLSPEEVEMLRTVQSSVREFHKQEGSQGERRDRGVEPGAALEAGKPRLQRTPEKSESGPRRLKPY